MALMLVSMTSLSGSVHSLFAKVDRNSDFTVAKDGGHEPAGHGATCEC